MNSNFKHGIPLNSIILLALVGVFFAGSFPAFVRAATTLASPDTNSDPRQSAFKLTVCDGPDLSGLKQGGTMTVMINGVQRVVTLNGSNPPGYIPCDFNAAMVQVQHLINIAIILGVFAAIGGFCYIGYLLISGGEANRSKAKEIFPKIFWGFIIMLSAWFVVYQLLSWLTGSGSGFSQLLGKP